MNVSDWLSRIGYRDRPRVDLATLKALHRAHVTAVPFENLDVQLGKSVGLQPGAIYEKIVDRRRGGWCYELNGLFGWGLRELGFDVVRLCAGVMRIDRGDAALGNHLCLLVRLGGARYLADVGFGGSMIEPLPLQKTERLDAPYHLTLTELGGDLWRFSEHTGKGDHFSYDFSLAPVDEARIAHHCRALQTEPSSTFVQNLVVQRRSSDGHLVLQGRVLGDRLLSSADELVAVLRDTFDLDVPEAAGLWPRICARHSELGL